MHSSTRRRLPAYRSTLTAGRNLRRLPIYAPPPIILTEQPSRLPRFTVTPEDVATAVGPPPPSLPVFQPGEQVAAVPRLPTFHDPAPPTALDAAARLQREQNAPVAGNRTKSALYGAAEGARAAAGSGSLGYTLGAALGGAFGGALNKKLYGDKVKEQAVARAKEAVAVESALAKERREREAQAAENDLRRAQAEHTRSVKPLEAEARIRRQQQNGVLAQLRLMKGQRLDPNNPAHLALLQRAAEVGVEVDPDSWNNSSSNFVSAEVVDPDNPTQRRRQFYNKATGELVDVGQSNYVQPVGPDGLTEAQRRGDADRDAGRSDTNERFDRTFGLSVDRFGEQQRHNTVTERQGERRLAASAGKAVARGGQSGRELTLLDSFAREKELSYRAPTAAARARHVANAQAIGVALRDNHGYEFGQDERGHPYVKPRATPAPPRSAYTADEVRARARAAGKDPDAALNAARARGLVRE